MKRMKNFVLFLASALLIVGCATDNVSESMSQPQGDSTVVVEVPVSASSAVDSRIAVSDNGDGGYSVKWSTGDTVGAWSDEPYGIKTLPEMTISSFDEEQSVFTGSVSTDAETLRFVYPYPTATFYAKDNTNKTETTYDTWYNAFDISMARQTAVEDLSHLSATTYMVSDTFSVDDTTSSQSMSHIGAVVDLYIQCIEAEAAGYTLSQVSVSCETLPTSATINLQKSGYEDDGFVEVLSCGEIIISVPQYSADASGVYPVVPFNVLPFTAAAGGEISVTATFEDADGNAYKGVRTIAISEAKEFARATRNTIKASISDALTSEESLLTWSLTTSDYTTASYAANTGSFVKDGVGYYSSSVYQSSSAMQWKKTEGYI